MHSVTEECTIMDADIAEEAFFTDKELCARWKCSPMKLWRMRNQGKLKRPTKIGGELARNLTHASEVRRLEAQDPAALPQPEDVADACR
jgi:hypothetical protein